METLTENGNGNGGSFADFIVKEREKLTTQRETLREQMAKLEVELSGIDREMQAIDAYEIAKSGRTDMPRRGPARRRGTAVVTARRGSKREALLTVIRNNPNGLKRGEIIDKMGLKGDKSGEMSVSNALTALIKNGTIDRREGKYVALSAVT
jgi:hypothetical protein